MKLPPNPLLNLSVLGIKELSIVHTSLVESAFLLVEPELESISGAEPNHQRLKM